MTPKTQLAEPSEASSPQAIPVTASERIASVDVVRGVAVLGILLMNIVPFGLPGAAYDNPTVYGGASGADFWAWAINAVFFEGKMRALFSMLFGAGVLLLTSRAEERGAGASVADIHARRNLWLVGFGLIDAWLLLWAGDILYTYGLMGLILYPFRKLSPRWLIVIALVLFSLAIPRMLVQDHTHREMQVAAVEATAAAERGESLTDEQQGDLANWREYLSHNTPDAKALEETIEANRSGYTTWWMELSGLNVYFQSQALYESGLTDVLSMMLLGLGLAKLGFFSAAWSARRYVLVVAIGYGIGIPLGIWRAKALVDCAFDPLNYAGPNSVYDLARLLMALAHAGVVMLICQAGLLTGLRRRLQAVGQMALTNYLSQALLCTLFFNGYGLGYFATLTRHELYYVVVSVWVLQLLWSPWWLARFRYGPVEWLWRSLTYWKRQPMRIERR